MHALFQSTQLLHFAKRNQCIMLYEHIAYASFSPLFCYAIFSANSLQITIIINFSWQITEHASCFK